MSQVPQQETDAAAFGVCGVGKGIRERCASSGWTLRVVRRSARAGGLLVGGYGLVEGARAGRRRDSDVTLGTCVQITPVNLQRGEFTV